MICLILPVLFAWLSIQKVELSKIPLFIVNVNVCFTKSSQKEMIFAQIARQ